MARKKLFEKDLKEDVEKIKVVEEVAKSEVKAKRKYKASKRTTITNDILDFIRTHAKTLSEELVDKVVSLDALPARGIRGPSAPSASGTIRNMMIDQKYVHEDIFWEKFKQGRMGMRRIFYNLRMKNKDPKNNLYIHFDHEKKVYVLDGAGPEAPKGFEA